MHRGRLAKAQVQVGPQHYLGEICNKIIQTTFHTKGLQGITNVAEPAKYLQVQPVKTGQVFIKILQRWLRKAINYKLCV